MIIIDKLIPIHIAFFLNFVDILYGIFQSMFIYNMGYIKVIIINSSQYINISILLAIISNQIEHYFVNRFNC